MIADIGGTYARFALETAPAHFEHQASLRCADHADFHAAVTAYLGTLPADMAALEHAGIAIANPVEGDQVRMTNYHWQFSIEQMRERLGLQTLVVVNDFTALAMALPRLGPHQRRQVGGGAARERSVVGVLGAGTGLGVSGLIPAYDGWVALGTEGGHTSFAPRDEREIAILRYAMREFSHVSFERLLSGRGIELIYRALLDHAGRPVEPLPAPEITRRALAGSDAVCTETLDAFCAVLGTTAGNLAVTLGAFGGIYIGGGIVPRLGDYFDRSPFRARFEDKGRFSAYVRDIPSFVVTAEQATFVGVSAILHEQLRGGAPAGSGDPARDGATILGQIQRARPQLSPAERRVADHVLAHPRSALNDPIATIARAASVSQPTVIRFCRSLGCEGLSDFKLRLASGLTSTVPVTHTQVTGEDTMLELGVKVLGNTASAILQVRDHLNRETIDRAIEVLTAARRVEFYAVGHYGVVADDAQFKFLRFGVPSTSLTDSRLQLLAASVLVPGDVAVIISSSGRIDELLEVADAAHARGAAVIAITASQSPLTKKADVALIVDHVEDVATHVPMISRILHLLVIDILAVGVAMRRGAPNGAALPDATAAGLDETQGAQPDSAQPPADAAAPKAARRVGLGISSAGPLAHLTSHSR
ncbi:glucokinase [Rubrivivax sp. RP6-9]|uniref:glucokinase n=1 Tax=Rubrivivax sp. RP6-9 TaxID=3415750 RepID=UPI003CC6D2B1